MKNEFLVAIAQLAAEKNLPREVVFEAVEAALASAYKKDALASANIVVRIDPDSGTTRVFARKEVVEEVEDPKTQITRAEAKQYLANPQIGDVVDLEVTPANAGRIAAQTAKQVVLQRLREAEREVVFEEYSGKEGDIVSGVVLRLEGRSVIIDLGKTEAVLPPSEQVRTEHYRPGQRLKLYLLEVHKAAKGPQVVVSRTHKQLLKRLFELEVPEIFKGVVEIKSIAREPGYRSKVAVWARQEGVDPVGACVGLRGIRIQNIVNELNGERIDVVQWDPDPARFVANALSPAQVLQVQTREEENTAEVVVPDRQLSLAIGKEGQNARLAAKLTGWRIDIKSQAAFERETSTLTPEEREAAPPVPAGVIAEPEPDTEMEPVRREPARPPTPEEEAVAAFAPPEAPAPSRPETMPAPGPAPAPGRPVIRFAEEVLTPAAAEAAAARAGKRKAKPSRTRDEDEGRARRPRKGGGRRVYLEEEEEFDYSAFDDFTEEDFQQS